MWAWGAGSYGQLGNSAATTPLKVNLAGVRSVAAGGAHDLVVTTDGATWAWGDNNTGQLGDGCVCVKTCATAVAGGYVHSLVAMADGAIRA